MKIIVKYLFVFLFLFGKEGISFSQVHKKQLFDFGWQFYKGGLISPEINSFDTSDWINVDLPHDWSIEDLPNTQSPFSKNAIGQVNTGFTTGGTAWYKKTFNIPISDNDKKIAITFEGVYMNATVWLNGKLLGGNAYGYSQFSFDITDKIYWDKKNILLIKVANEGENSRWYSGSGIYRHVWLNTFNTLNIADWGVFVTTPFVSKNNCQTNISTKLNNETANYTTLKLVSSVFDKQRKLVQKSITSIDVKPNSEFLVNQNAGIKNPIFWTVQNPYLYTLESKIYSKNKLLDSCNTVFGIRDLKFNTNGFFINGINTKLKGGCIHHDNGPLGAKAYDRAEVRKVETLKAAGYNAVRTSHNPPSVAFLNACDSLGLLVIDEAFDCWKDAKNTFDYNLYFDKYWKKDIDAMVLRDRNHPSIIMWSTGNEIPNREKLEVVKVSAMISQYIKMLDNTRPVTSAVNDLKPDKDPFFATLDISGYNYAVGGDHLINDLYAIDHLRVPQRLMYESEAYPLEAFDSWQKVLEKPYVFGAFVWTALDYIGEASIGWHGYWPDDNSYPWTLAYCGDIDICGNKRPAAYYRDALWKKNQLALFVKPPSPSFPINPNREAWSKWHWYDVQADWNWQGYENKLLNVVTYSSCDEVELFLNKKSLGKKPTNKSTKFLANWDVPYQEGTLKAIAYTNNKQVNTSILQTATTTHNINLKADRSQIKANGQDLSYIQVTLNDKNNILNPKANNLIKFELTGPGKIVGVGNANPISLESFQLPQRKAWQGKCMVIIKSTQKQGEIILKAFADDLLPAQITIKTNN